MRQFLCSFLVVIVFHGLVPTVWGQAKNLIANGDFKRGSGRDNLWDGVDSSGGIKFVPRAKRILIAGGEEQERPFPPSLNFVDMDNDGLSDIVATDPTGFYFFFKNKGTAQEPLFDAGELIPIFFETPGEDVSSTPKIHVVKWRGTANDIIVGDYLGRVLSIPNKGTGKPDFAMPKDLKEILVQTRGEKLWGNFFAPFVVDWNKDGKKDLILGEGTYSANAIHLFLNEGSDTAPKFSEKNYLVLAYGMGREQLVPNAVDWDGDGVLDLIVGSREGVADQMGTISFYKGLPFSGSGRVPQLEFTKLVEVGGSPFNGVMAAPHVCDFNGDGLLDILMASSSDCKVKVALNQGTKTEPKLAAFTNVKAEDSLKRYKEPVEWRLNYDARTPNNQYAVMEIVQSDKPDENDYDKDAAPPEGTTCFKAHFPTPKLDFFPKNFLVPDTLRKIGPAGEGDYKVSLAASFPFVLGKGYDLKMQSKGKATTVVAVFQVDQQVDESVDGQGRKWPVTEPHLLNLKLPGGASWAATTRSINFAPKPARKPALKYKDGTSLTGSLTIYITGTGQFYLDDIQLTEK
ncbi:MAG: VCBS repeat-containing protein [Verrucomicrobiota bacterium]|nr:VCBS repeat-containing protein [Verrucomicrobiota bacterium]